MSSNRDLSIQGIHIQTLYTEYTDRRFLINRKYQRKLAWTIEEKRNFMDTIIKGLPIPLFLMAEVKYDGQMKLEVIDGMQRLDAIFSFINQRYSLKDGFFDLSVMADTFNMVSENKINQERPVLDRETCRDIANYLLPISKSIALNEVDIEDTFRRINSNGRHLSSQELRQAGATGYFPELVRELSIQIRGDVSKDSLVLNEMSRISLSNKRLTYYGLYVFDIFWVRHKIISAANIRDSRDEEIIGHIIANMIVEEKENFTSHSLDSYYGFSSNPLSPVPIGKTKIENSIDRISFDKIKKQFNIVFSTIEDLLIKNNLLFRDLIYKGNSGNLSLDNYRAFQVIFMSFFELIVRQSKKIINEDKLVQELLGIGNELINQHVVDKLYDAHFQEKTVKSVIGRIQDCFDDKEISDPAYDDWTSEFTKILMLSVTEQNQYDFKIGVFDIGNNNYNESLVLKIVKTLSAINNLGPNKVGYVIIGVADKEADALIHKNWYKQDFVKKHDFNIVGIEAEANKCIGNVDRYLHKIKETIRKAPVQPVEFLHVILSKLKSRRYFGKEILVLETEFNKPVWYNGELYEREGSENRLVKKERNHIIYDRFQK